MNSNNVDKWDQLFKESAKVTLNYLKSGDPHELHHAKIATAVLSNFTRHEATESAQKQTAVIIARQIAGNKEEFAEYLRLSGVQVPQKQLSVS